MLWWEILITVAASLALLLILITRYTYSVAFMRKPQREGKFKTGDDEVDKRLEKMRTELEALPYEEVVVSSHDGLKLVGRLYLKDESRPFEIQIHGYRSNPTRDFSGGGTEVLLRGDNLLLVYHRAHGKSEGRTICFGIKERYDVRTWAEYIVGRFGENVRISLAGVSMGGATVLMASSLDLPKAVKYIVADCPYSSPREIISLVAGNMGFPRKITYPFIKLGAMIWGGFNPDSYSAVDAVKNTRLPIILLHGEADGFVPCDMSRKIKESSPENVTLFTFQGADHGMSYTSNRDKYIGEINKFREKYLIGE